MSTLVIALNSSPERWIEVPLPDDAKLTVPGLALANSISSFTVLYGREGCDTSRFGTMATREMG